MSTVTLFNAPHMLSQQCSDDTLIPESSIAVSHDASPILVVVQGDQEILINLESVNELCKLLKKVKAAAVSFESAKGD